MTNTRGHCETQDRILLNKDAINGGHQTETSTMYQYSRQKQNATTKMLSPVFTHQTSIGLHCPLRRSRLKATAVQPTRYPTKFRVQAKKNTHLGDEQGTHTRTSPASHGVRQLETLQRVTGLRLFTHNVKHRVDQLSALGVVALRPVVPRAGLSENKVVRAKQLPERARSHRVHGPRLEVHEDGARHVAPAGCFIEVAADALELEVRVSVVVTGGVDAVLVGDDLPEFGTDLREQQKSGCV